MFAKHWNQTRSLINYKINYTKKYRFNFYLPILYSDSLVFRFSGQRFDGDEWISAGPERSVEDVGQANRERDCRDGAGSDDHQHSSAVASSDAPADGERGRGRGHPSDGHRQRGHRSCQHRDRDTRLDRGGLHGASLDTAADRHHGAADDLDERLRTTPGYQSAATQHAAARKPTSVDIRRDRAPRLLSHYVSRT